MLDSSPPQGGVSPHKHYELVFVTMTGDKFTPHQLKTLISEDMIKELANA
jgi:hypothetical protein